MTEKANKKQLKLLSDLRRCLRGSATDHIGERFFNEHNKEMDRVLCYELAITLVIVMLSFVEEMISDNIYLIRGDVLTKTVLTAAVIFLTSSLIIGIAGRNRYWNWYRYLAAFAMTVANFGLSAYMTLTLDPLILFPIFLAVLYYDAVYTFITAFLALTARICGLLIYYREYLAYDYEYIGDALYKLNTKNVTDTIALALIFITSVICVMLTRSMRKTMEDKLLQEQEKTIIERDMDTAGKIQNAMLIKRFPSCKEYDVAAYMMPARMIGGDFYDFIELNEDRVAIVIADVSGKGLQASLYMSQVKALIKVYAQSENSVDKIAEKTNSYLTEGLDRPRLFVTVWVGILDLRSGTLYYTNAGHNPPCISTNGEAYKYMDSCVNFVLGGKKLIKYSENQIKLKPGDKLFLYTDGVTEAKNEKGSFYSEKALLNCLNENLDASPADAIEKIKGALAEYSANAEQYDDITMLAFSFKEYAQKKTKQGKTFPADTAHFSEAIKYIRSECEKIGCPDNINKDIEIACSELAANICSYAYKGETGDFEVMVEECGREVKISFTDHGKPFNPLLNDTPDTTASFSARKAGGLGVFIVKKLMNDVLYRYENGCNVLVLIKLFK